MEKKFQLMKDTLRRELIPALGCTEPIAIAYAAAVARKYFADSASEMRAMCSRNIIKNVMGVKIPGAGGLMGIDTCVYMGYICGDPDKKMEVISGATERDVEAVRRMKEQGLCAVGLLDSPENLHIVVSLKSAEHSCEVTIAHSHLNVVKIVSDGKVIQEQSFDAGEDEVCAEEFEVEDIIRFANSEDFDDLKPLLDLQIECNMRIAEEGLKNEWGAQVGRIVLKSGEAGVFERAIAHAAAGSDARMAGCTLPVYINSGSGNQGITVSVPLVVYAREMNVSRDRLYRALLVSNLFSLHFKSRIGRLSAFCGAVSAGCGFGAALTYLETDGDLEAIKRTIVNCLGTTSGIICDGAKESCAAKIAVSLHTAVLAHKMSLQGLTFPAHTGIVKEELEDTLRAAARVANPGMNSTDLEILEILIH